MTSSWLGRWDSNGWSIKIDPELTEEQWSRYGAMDRGEVLFDRAARSYPWQKAVKALAELVPGAQLKLTFPDGDQFAVMVLPCES